MHVRISDQKMKDVLCLINSIPLPQKSSTQSPERQVMGMTQIFNLLFSDNCCNRVAVGRQF